jgi:hypothetical protein
MKESVQAATTETEQHKLEILRGFFDRYAQRNKDSNEALRLVTPFVEKFEIELPTLKDNERIWEVSAAPHFNIFQVLRIERKEEKLPSRFIAALLNPNGSHSQGQLFLNLFLGVAREATQGCRFRGPGLFAADSRWHPNMKERDLDNAFAGLIEDSCFNFDACPKSLADESQGLSYRIETHREYFGFGLAWREEAQELSALYGLASVQNLSNRLRQYKCNGLELELEPNKWWFWWAYWKRDIYDGSPWSWFSKERDPAWFEAKAKSFWDFVGQIHELVTAANENGIKHHLLGELPITFG